MITISPNPEQNQDINIEGNNKNIQILQKYYNITYESEEQFQEIVQRAITNIQQYIENELEPYYSGDEAERIINLISDRFISLKDFFLLEANIEKFQILIYQMKADNNTLSDIKMVKALINFWLLLACNQVDSTLKINNKFCKINSTKNDVNNNFLIYKTSESDYPRHIKSTGPKVIKEMLGRNYQINPLDRIYLCGSDFSDDCQKICLEENNLFPMIIDNITDGYLDYIEEDKPDIYYSLSNNNLHINCGKCLIDLRKHELSQEIYNDIFENTSETD